MTVYIEGGTNGMKLTEKEAALEAILFTMGKQWKTKRLAEAIGVR